ncbi:hypothetical protein BLOT_010649 [Blomia tropicalis]|nr:hypothetical protein BLOT_010649 [Blomia tropicalis]
MLLDPMQTSSLNRLIAIRFHCNSTETKSLLNLVMCNSSTKPSLRFDLDRVIHNDGSNTNLTYTSLNEPQRMALKRFIVMGSKIPSQVYHVFYSSASFDSIIYILAILCIYFLLFSLLIYANWNTFNNYGPTSKRRKRRHHRKQRNLSHTKLLSTPTPGSLNTVVCLLETTSTIGKNPEAKIRMESDSVIDGGRKEPSDTNTTTILMGNSPIGAVNI